MCMWNAHTLEYLDCLALSTPKFVLRKKPDSFFPFPFLSLLVPLQSDCQKRPAERSVIFFEFFPYLFGEIAWITFRSFDGKWGNAWHFLPPSPSFSLMSEWEEGTLNFLATDTPFPHSFLGKKGIKNKKGASPFKIWIDFSDRREGEEFIWSLKVNAKCVRNFLFPPTYLEFNIGWRCNATRFPAGKKREISN